MTKRPLPSDEVLNALYSKLMVSSHRQCSIGAALIHTHTHTRMRIQEKLELAPEKVVEMNRMSREQKWSLICAQVTRN